MLDLNLRKKKASIIKHILFPIYFGCRSIVYNIYLCCVVSEKTEEKIHDIIERLRCSKKNGQGLTHSDMSTIRLLILNHDIKGKHDLVYLALPARTLNRHKDPVYKTNDMMVLKGEYEATKRKKKKRKKRQQYLPHGRPCQDLRGYPFLLRKEQIFFCLANL